MLKEAEEGSDNNEEGPVRALGRAQASAPWSLPSVTLAPREANRSADLVEWAQGFIK